MYYQDFSFKYFNKEFRFTRMQAEAVSDALKDETSVGHYDMIAVVRLLKGEDIDELLLEWQSNINWERAYKNDPVMDKSEVSESEFKRMLSDSYQNYITRLYRKIKLQLLLNQLELDQ
jgi:hypothetical protein